MFIDADAHVIETEQTWEFMEEEGQTLRAGPPGVAGEAACGTGALTNGWCPTPTSASTPPRSPGVGQRGGADCPHGRVVGGRTGHLSYAVKQGGGRIRWVVLAPAGSMDRAIEEIHFGKDNGACGVFMHGLRGRATALGRYLFPPLSEASDLDMPICIHAGGGNLGHYDLFAQDVFSRFKLPAVGAFNNLIYKGIPDKFPKLRWCFVETTSQWVPYALNDLLIRTRAEMAFRRQHADSALAGVRGAPRELADRNLLRDNRIYVACQTTDDLPYVLEYAGEDSIIVGTDYGHADYSNDMEAIARLSQEGVLAAGAADKILSDNPRRLYGL